MANVLIGYNNYVDAAALAGGTWVTTLPLANIQNRTIGRVARTTSAATSATKFNLDLVTARQIGVFALVAHNLSLAGKVRVRATTEATATNLFTYSDEQSQSVWAKSNITVTSNASGSPDGGGTADHIHETAVTSFFSSEQSFSRTSGTVQRYAISVFLRPGVRQFARLQITAGSSNISQFVDLANGAFIGTMATSGTEVTFVASKVTTGFILNWCRYEIVFDVASPVTSVKLSMFAASNATTVVFAGVTGQISFIPWGAQAELLPAGATAATSYYPSGAAQGVRPVGYMDDYQPYTYDSGYVSAWPGTVTSLDQVAGYNALHAVKPDLTARYWSVLIQDTANAAGYVQLGRVFVGDAWTPRINMSYGAGHGWEDQTEVQEALSGAEYFGPTKRYRVTKFTTAGMSVAEGVTRASEIQRRVGITGEVILLFDSADTLYALQRNYLGRLRQLSPIEYPYPDNTRTAWEIKELL